MKGPEALYYNMPHSTKIFILQSQLLYGFYFLKKKNREKMSLESGDGWWNSSLIPVKNKVRF
jgi:hypothetical protein